MTLYTSTQGADVCRTFAGLALGIPPHHLTVKCQRLGGGFGAKLTKCVWNAVGAAVCAHVCRKPVKFQNDIATDMALMGHCRYVCHCLPFLIFFNKLKLLFAFQLTLTLTLLPAGTPAR